MTGVVKGIQQRGVRKPADNVDASCAEVLVALPLDLREDRCVIQLAAADGSLCCLVNQTISVGLAKEHRTC